MRRTILMLEHDEDDRYITQSVFDDRKFDVTYSLSVVAMNFLPTSRVAMELFLRLFF